MIKKLILLLILATCNCFAQEVPIKDNASTLITKIMENANYCVKNMTRDKIYLCPKSIFSTEEGLYLDLDGLNRVTLHVIYSDNKGPFLFTKCPNAKREIYCSVCDRWHVPPPCIFPPTFLK